MLLQLPADTIDPTRVFLTDMYGSLTFGEFGDEVARVADELAQTGLVAGERVGVLANNSIECVVCLFAINQLNSVFVPINYRSSENDIAHIVDDCGIEKLFTVSANTTAFSERWSAASVQVAGRAITLLQRNLPTGATGVTGAEELTALFYTSGSTGKSKGVMLSAANLERAARSVASFLRLEQQDVLLCVLPISFDAGFSQITAALAAGAGLVLLNYMLPNDIPRSVERFGVTVLTGVPPLYARIVGANWNEQARDQIRVFASTGGDLPPSLLGALRNLFRNADAYPMYGLTEAFRATCLAPDMIDAKPGSVGQAIPDAEVFVLREDGTRCTSGEIGEIVQCGPLVSLGYWGRTEGEPGAYARFAPAPLFSQFDGACVYSGDLGYTDEDGYLFIVGRRDGMIKVDGHRISPLRIESILLDHALVRECVIVIDDWSAAHQKSIVGVLMSEHDDVAELSAQLGAHLAEAGLPAAQRPLQYLLVQSLPRDLNGKISRKECIRMVRDA